MPLTDTQVKNAKLERRPPVRFKGKPGKRDSDESAAEKSANINTQPAKKYNTKSGEQPKSYKLYDADNSRCHRFTSGFAATCAA
jgi:hypothetical protein